MIAPDVNMDAKFLELMKLINTYLGHFPKHEKFALANIIRTTAYEVYNLMTECRKRYHKKTTLTQLDIKHEQLRMQIRLAWRLGYFGFKAGRMDADYKSLEERRYLTLSRLVDELGRMIGGWMRSIDER